MHVSSFYLCFITAWQLAIVSKCTGCGNKYIKSLILAHDLCVFRIVSGDLLLMLADDNQSFHQPTAM